MNAVLEAVRAAGVVYDRTDFSDPRLPRPTALTVTADGRVFGHLAKWGTCHIGYSGQCVTPPSSSSGYQYFHQGVVDTGDGPLPVGKITLGTGHASLGQDAQTAAAHYDNTGTVTALVRAGEDTHGIWLAGRLVPGTPQDRIDELRRSGVSGDWRGINGSMELVAALAVNVPGFPVPRTEQLVAAGGVASLVAAGVVAPVASMPTDADQLEALVDARIETRERVRDACATMAAVVASASNDRRAAAAAEVTRLAAAAAADSLTDTLTAGVPGVMPAQLKAYWTKGAGLARWAKSPHPYSALVKALQKEIHGKTPGWYKGLAANLFHATFGIWPGEREGQNPIGPGSGAVVVAAAAGQRRAKTQEGAKRYGVSVGDLIGQDVQNVKDRAGQYAEAAGRDLASLITGKRPAPQPAPKPAAPPAAKSETPKTPDAPAAPAAPIAKKSKAAKKEGPTNNPNDRGGSPGKAPVDVEVKTKAPTRKSGSGELLEDEAPDVGANGGKLVSFGDGVAVYDDGTQTNGSGWSKAARIKGRNGSPLAEGDEPPKGVNGGDLLEVKDGVAYYDDGSHTDGAEWSIGDAPKVKSTAAPKPPAKKAASAPAEASSPKAAKQDDARPAPAKPAAAPAKMKAETQAAQGTTPQQDAAPAKVLPFQSKRKKSAGAKAGPSMTAAAINLLCPDPDTELTAAGRVVVTARGAARYGVPVGAIVDGAAGNPKG